MILPQGSTILLFCHYESRCFVDYVILSTFRFRNILLHLLHPFPAKRWTAQEFLDEGMKFIPPPDTVLPIPPEDEEDYSKKAIVRWLETIE